MNLPETITARKSLLRSVISAFWILLMLGSLVSIFILNSRLESSNKSLQDETQKLTRLQDSIKKSNKVLTFTVDTQRNSFITYKTIAETKKLAPRLRANYVELAKKDSLNQPKTPDISNEIATQKEDSTLKNHPDASKFIIQDIKSTNVLTLPTTINDNYTLAGNPETLWCKSGYYILFNHGQLKIGINSINSNGVNARLTDMTTDKVLEANRLLNVGETFPRPVGDVQYRITLNYIGAAGRNPFTRAAYITVATYKK